MTLFRHVVFDLDGTLVDSYRALTIALNRAGAERLAVPFTEAHVRTLVGEGVERLLQKAFEVEQATPELIASFEREYEAVCCAESSILADVEETLRALAATNVSMAVCTNKPTSFSRQIIEHLKLGGLLPVVVGPDAAGSRKPDPAHLLFTMRSIDASPESTLFVGDMPIDIRAAQGAGVPMAAIATGSCSREELAAFAPDFMLDRFTDLLDVCAAGALRS